MNKRRWRRPLIQVLVSLIMNLCHHSNMGYVVESTSKLINYINRVICKSFNLMFLTQQDTYSKVPCIKASNVPDGPKYSMGGRDDILMKSGSRRKRKYKLDQGERENINYTDMDNRFSSMQNFPLPALPSPRSCITHRATSNTHTFSTKPFG